MSIYQTITKAIDAGKKLLFVLIDPGKNSEAELEILIRNAESSNVFAFLIGGSLVCEPIEKVISIIKKHSNKPAIIFPGNPSQVTPQADALFFLSLISGRNSDFLIGNHVTSSLVIKKYNIEPISVGYMLIDGGVTTSVQYISNTQPIPSHKPELSVATAVAGEMLGLKMIYLEGGSGAKNPVPAAVISEVRRNITIPIIVGGGLKTEADVKRALDAGADIIVIGNVLEKQPELVGQIAQLF